MDSSRKKKKSSLTKPHFFQPLLPDFQTNFTIPESFLTKYLDPRTKEEDDEKIAILRNTSFDNYWLVKVCYLDDDKLVFKDGWDKFCEDYGLEIGDFLAFEHHGNLSFDVVAFDPSACERPFPVSRLKQKETPKVVPRRPNATPKVVNSFQRGSSATPKVVNPTTSGFCRYDKEATFKFRGNPYCETLVRPYWFKWGALPFPKEFVEENDLANRSCDDIIVIDQRGNPWHLKLRCRRVVYVGKCYRFLRESGLKTGDLVIFELIVGEKLIMHLYNWG